ncbi:hypothetical protein PV08_06426 [Exophiala spinifera]|uniref:Uncharacterized protein n=1 Tax=Exophiala spinifera TaxID=91928 RepID=A0A0D2BCM9_9EURO|nr:uncharacterized protein PV08_06426 [Exophiala spinifera]KIW16375.1 hypothetical protein PV08_06426 [Exophiala spinifera]
MDHMLPSPGASNTLSFPQETLQLREFPPLTSTVSYAVLGDYWNGEYHSGITLLAKFADVGGETNESHEWLELRQSESKTSIDNGFVDRLRYSSVTNVDSILSLLICMLACDRVWI